MLPILPNTPSANPATAFPPNHGTDSHYKQLGLLLTLYFAQGLPAGFVTQALPAILRQYQVSLVAIGWSGLILVPWGIKFLWAPYVDRHFNAKFGRSRSWILPLQLLSIAVLVGVAWFNPQNLSNADAILGLYAMLLGLSFIGATHDVATDGLATRLLKPHTLKPKSVKSDTLNTATPEVNSLTEMQTHHKQGQGNAMQVIGYRGGLIIGGGVLLIMLDRVGWRFSFLIMAGLVLLNTLPILLYREPCRFNEIVPKKLANLQTFSLEHMTHYIHHHYQYFWSNREMKAWLGVLLTYKIADGISSGMVKPMMVDMGIKLEQIGFWATVLGSGSSILGAGVAAVLIKRLSRFQALVIFNSLQALTTGLYGLAKFAFDQHWINAFYWLYAINSLEHFCASLALVAMLTTIMHYTRHEQAGSDFTVQVCVMTVLGGSSHFLSGYMAYWLGYTTHFTLSMGIGLTLLLPIIYWHKVAKS